MIKTIGLASLLLAGCGDVVSPARRGERVDPSKVSPSEIIAAEAEILAFCGRCHVSPDPANFDRARWVDEVFRGLRFHAESPEAALPSPEPAVTIAWFQRGAPERLSRPPAPVFPADASPRFRKLEIPVAPVEGPGVSHLSWRAWRDDQSPRLVTTDMRLGQVAAWDAADWTSLELAKVPHPSHVEWCDLDADGRLDALVSNLGSYEPRDHSRGGIVWLHQQPDGQFKQDAVASGLGRVSETRTADLNGDGRQDVVVAEFGWRKTGRVLLFEQLPSSSSRPAFRRSVLDPRHGAIRTPPVDLDADGDLDIAVLFAQEHERLEVLLSDGAGKFEPRLLGAPADPSFGTSGMETSDLDGDGDLDFVVSNGDMFDNALLRPFHGLRWWENQGGLKFIAHELLAMPGVHGCSVADLDLDGDLDIATAACFPASTLGSLSGEERATWPSAVWLEQTSPGEFTPHVVEAGNPLHAAHLVADVDADGDADIVLGMLAATSLGELPPIVVFENLTRSPENAPSAAAAR